MRDYGISFHSAKSRDDIDHGPVDRTSGLWRKATPNVRPAPGLTCAPEHGESGKRDFRRIDVHVCRRISIGQRPTSPSRFDDRVVALLQEPEQLVVVVRIPRRHEASLDLVLPTILGGDAWFRFALVSKDRRASTRNGDRVLHLLVASTSKPDVESRFTARKLPAIFVGAFLADEAEVGVALLAHAHLKTTVVTEEIELDDQQDRQCPPQPSAPTGGSRR